MTSPELYEWDNLIGVASHIKIWHPNAIADPLAMPGLQPESIPSYGQRETIPTVPTRRREREKLLARVRQIKTTVILGQAALYQRYATEDPGDPPLRLLNNVALLDRTIREADSNHATYILPFARPMPVGASVPFAIYERPDRETVVARDIGDRIHFSTHPELVMQKLGLFDQLVRCAADDIEREELIRAAVTEQRETDIYE